MNRKIYSKSEPLLPVDHPEMYSSYHVAWGKSNGVVGIVKHINEVDKTVILYSPATHKEWKNPVKWSDLRHTRKMQQIIESNKNNDHANR